MRSLIKKWFYGESDPIDDLLDIARKEDLDRQTRKNISKK